ncbi:MAG: helix-turn-helix transcriptional regulator [Mangrovibacterium sp.]
MNNRIKRFMEYCGLSPSEMADAISVQRSNMTHVLHGRNKPGFQFITKMLETFPELNAKWLLTGEGEMLVAAIPKATRQSSMFEQIREKTPASEVKNLTEKAKKPVQTGDRPGYSPAGQHADPKTDQTDTVQKDRERGLMIPVEYSKKVKSIVVFYTDQTFIQYLPSE